MSVDCGETERETEKRMLRDSCLEINELFTLPCDAYLETQGSDFLDELNRPSFLYSAFACFLLAPYTIPQEINFSLFPKALPTDMVLYEFN